MAYEEPKQSYTGKIREVTVGAAGSEVTVGGENTLPFYLFEGEMPKDIAIAMEVYDKKPEDWPEVVIEPFKDVIDSPAQWAKKCQDEYKADLICLQLASTDPNRGDTSADDATKIVKEVLDAILVPLIIYGGGNVEKDAEVLKKVADVAQGKNILIAPAVEDNYKTIAAAAMGFKQNVAGLSPIDVNMAKQLNILMTQLGLEAGNLVIDPSSGALGYGLEYCYSVMERLRLAALEQNDSMTQMPMISNLGKEVWKTKEAKASEQEEPDWGDAEKRGIMWEALTAVAFALAGSNILVMRHPKAVELVRETIKRLRGKE